MTRKYGWKPQLPDFRDKLCSLTAPETLPESVDLRPQMPPVYDQGKLGGCTSMAIAGAIQYDQLKNNNAEKFEPSRLFIYFQERFLENTVSSDSGASLRDGVKVCATVGVCPDSVWPYDISKFTENPSAEAYTEALEHKIQTYEAVNQDLQSMQTVLANGFPIILGISVYSSFESETVEHTGIVQIPGENESLLGGHAIMCVGFQNSTKQFIMRNSWSSTWGLEGYFMIPYEYLLNSNLCSDLWCINTTA